MGYVEKSHRLWNTLTYNVLLFKSELHLEQTEKLQWHQSFHNIFQINKTTHEDANWIDVEEDLKIKTHCKHAINDQI